MAETGLFNHILVYLEKCYLKKNFNKNNCSQNKKQTMNPIPIIIYKIKNRFTFSFLTIKMYFANLRENEKTNAIAKSV